MLVHSEQQVFTRHLLILNFYNKQTNKQTIKQTNKQIVIPLWTAFLPSNCELGIPTLYTQKVVIPSWTTCFYAPPSNFELGISTAYKQKSCYSIMNDMFLRTTF